MAKPRVTIGVCARNAQDCIGSAIESVIQQNFPHELMEIIVVDDGSTDNTLKLVQNYALKTDIPIRVFSSAWRGLGKARNTVINNANGEYVIWLDSDELLGKDFVRNQVSLMEQNARAGIITARWGILPNENAVLVLELIPSVVESLRQKWQKTFKLPGTGGSTYRVKAAKQAGGFDETIKELGEDMEIANRIRKAGWLIIRGNAIFYERHGKLSTWKALWTRYFNFGKQARQICSNTKIPLSIYRINPIASFITSIQYAFFGFKITKRKTVLALPFHFTFKMVAWFCGFNAKPKNFARSSASWCLCL